MYPPEKVRHTKKRLLRRTRFRWTSDPGDYAMLLVAKKYLLFIKEEIRVDYRRRGWSCSRRLLGSISFRITSDNKGIEFYSTWPNLNQVIEGSRPYRMTWLRRANVPIVPIWDKDSKDVRFRTTPLTGTWIHPGIRRMLFMNRARTRLNKWIASMAYLAAISRN